MNHETVHELLEDYVDERLEPSARREVDQHLRTCDDCRSLLDGVDPVDLTALGAASWDEAAMRRLVLRSLLRTAVNVAAIFLAGGLVILLVSQLVLQPLLVDRGGRAAAATVATADIAVLFNPGTAVADYEFDSGLLSRTSSARLVRPTGTALVELGSVHTKIGLSDFGDEMGGTVFPFLVNETGGTSGLDENLAATAGGTVATAELLFDVPVDIEQAQSWADGPHDVRVIWAGFDIGSAAEGRAEDGLAGWVSGVGVGYSACDASPLTAEFVGSGGGSGGGSTFNLPSNIERARAETMRALANLVEHPEIARGVLSSDVTAGAFAEAHARIQDDPAVRSLVVTGPTEEVARFVAMASPSFGSVRDIDFTNWFAPLCGR